MRGAVITASETQYEFDSHAVTNRVSLGRLTIKYKMKNSVREELSEYITERVQEMKNYKELSSDIGDIHNEIFNQDYYIIGYYNADKWLQEHNISSWEAMSICTDWENENFGECSGKYDNAETTVNMLAYIWGMEILYDLEEELIN